MEIYKPKANSHAKNKKLTKQTFFNQAVDHLLRQNAKPLGYKHGRPEDKICVYRAPNGNMCAFGPFIPDRSYNPTLEGGSADSELVFPKTSLSSSISGLARHIQSIHDNYTPEYWLTNLAILAQEENLDFPL